MSEAQATPKQRALLLDLGYEWHDDPTLTKERASYLIGKLIKRESDERHSELMGAWGDMP